MAVKTKLPVDIATRNTPWTGLPSNWYEYYGFVYLITNTITQQKYVGRKYFWTSRLGKIHKESDWKTYKSSSDYVLEDIITNGLHIFLFEVVSVHHNRQETNFAEIEYQIKHDVLTSKLPNGEFEYYNKSINSRYYRPADYGTPEWIAKRQKQSETRKRFYENGGKHPMKEKVHPNKGKKLPQTGHQKRLGMKHTPEAKAKMKETRKQVLAERGPSPPPPHIEKTCQLCAKSYIGHPRSKFCSTLCATANKAARHRERYRARKT